MSLKDKIRYGIMFFGSNYAFEYGKFDRLEGNKAYYKIENEEIVIHITELDLLKYPFGC